MLFFYDQHPRADGTQFPMTGVWQELGDMVTFSGEARMNLMHGVLQDLPDSVQKLPLTVKELKSAVKSNPKWGEEVRVVATLRCGAMSKQSMRECDKQWKALPQADEEEDCTTSEPDGAIVRQRMDGCLVHRTK